MRICPGFDCENRHSLKKNRRAGRRSLTGDQDDKFVSLCDKGIRTLMSLVINNSKLICIYVLYQLTDHDV
jgi:hypothetical protein